MYYYKQFNLVLEKRKKRKTSYKKLSIFAYDGGTPFQAEIYFINLAKIVQVRFGVPFFDVFDPRFSDYGVPIAVRGTISFNIKDYREFIKLHRINTFNLEDFEEQIRDAVTRYVKDAVANAPASHDIPLVQIEAKTSQINDAIEYDLGERLREDFGVNVSGVDIGAIEIDKSSEGFQKLMEVTKELAAVKVKAETEDYVERLRIQREEGQYSMHKQTQSENIGAFQVEKQAEVGIAGAEALGHMGENDAGSVNLSGSTEGFNPAAMMAGIALGGAVGQNIAGVMNQAMGGIQNQAQNVEAPPQIPILSFHVAENGKDIGSFNLETIKEMVESGKISKTTYLWKSGMSEWKAAGLIEEVKDLFVEIPPIPKE